MENVVKYNYRYDEELILKIETSLSKHAFLDVCLQQLLSWLFFNLYSDGDRQNQSSYNKEVTTQHIAKLFLRIKGMTCASCVSLIEKSLIKKHGNTVATKYTVNYLPFKAVKSIGKLNA